MHDFNLKIKTKYTSYLLTSVQFKNKITEVILIIKKKKITFIVHYFNVLIKN